MSERKIDPEWRGVIGSVAAVLVGLGAAWLSKSVLRLEFSDAAFIALMILPILAYLILSEKIIEFTGPGGIGAKFESVAKQTINPAKETIEPDIQEPELVGKRTINELKHRLRQLDESKPIFLTLTVGRKRYEEQALRSYLEALTQYPKFRYVVLLRSNGQFIAFMPVWVLRYILRETQLTEWFVEGINSGHVGPILDYPGVVTTPISPSTTNIEALEEMTKQNTNSLIVVNDKGRLIGLVERDQILSKLMLAIAGE